MAGEKNDGTAATPPRDTYMPRPPSKPEVDQVSREQGIISDEWAGEPSAAERNARRQPTQEDKPG